MFGGEYMSLDYKKIFSYVISGIILCTMTVYEASCADWSSFRGNPENNAAVSCKTPRNADEAVMYWSLKKGESFESSSIGSPIIADDCVIFCNGNTLYKADRYTGKILAQNEMYTNSSYNIISPTYADGMIYVGLSNATIQAFNADTLESVWIYRDGLGGQSNSPIVYSNGYIYTGFWNTETSDANYVCISVSDDNPESGYEEKTAVWKYTRKGGFYWSGAYVNDNFALVGTCDGEQGFKSETSSLISFNPLTGDIIDSIDNLNGDICSSVVYDKYGTDRYYFTSKGGSFYSIEVNSDGTFRKSDSGEKGYALKSINLQNMNMQEKSMSTSTPVIYNGRAYVGVCGSSQFKMYSGHCISVIDLESMRIAYNVPTKGYPQVSGLLSTAYTDSDGYAYIYFVDNYIPGQVRVIRDKKGLNHAADGVKESYMSAGKYTTVENCAPVLFTPSGEEAQYAISSPIADEEGTLYFKNDSSNIIAVGSSIENIEVVKQPDKLVYREGEIFDKNGIKVIAKLKNGLSRDITDYVKISDEELSVYDTDVTLSYDVVRYHDVFDAENGNQCGVEVSPYSAYVDITVISEEAYASAEAVCQLIDGIGDVSLGSGKSIQLARLSYDGLDAQLKELVNNYDTLVNAEKEYSLLYSVCEKIRSIGEVTAESRNLINTARESYENLTETQKSKITNYCDLEVAERLFAELSENVTETEKTSEHTTVSATENYSEKNGTLPSAEFSTDKQNSYNSENQSSSGKIYVDTGNDAFSAICTAGTVLLSAVIFSSVLSARRKRLR